MGGVTVAMVTMYVKVFGKLFKICYNISIPSPIFFKFGMKVYNGKRMKLMLLGHGRSHRCYGNHVYKEIVKNSL